MTYWLLNLGFTLAAAAVAAAYAFSARREPGGPRDDGGPRRDGGHDDDGERKRWGAAVAVTVVALCVLTAVFDNVMIAAGLFEYSSEQISGWRIGAAPVEDFLYVLAAALLLPALWQLLAARSGGRRRE